eukprot:scaffold6772_cov169-Skeletonema_marinoi.AAC.2
MLEPWQRCFYTIMASYDGLQEGVDCRIHSVTMASYDGLQEGVDCRIHSVRYDMVLLSSAYGRPKLLLIR